MPVHFHVQDRASVQLGADTPRSRREGPPYSVAVQSVSPEADPYVQGCQKIRGPAEALEEIRIDIHEPPAADPGDLPEDLLRLLRERPSLHPREREQKVRHSCRSAVPPVAPVDLRELPGRKTVFISRKERSAFMLCHLFA